jgi:hypothetical protein
LQFHKHDNNTHQQRNALAVIIAHAAKLIVKALVVPTRNAVVIAVAPKKVVALNN